MVGKEFVVIYWRNLRYLIREIRCHQIEGYLSHDQEEDGGRHGPPHLVSQSLETIVGGDYKTPVMNILHCATSSSYRLPGTISLVPEG